MKVLMFTEKDADGQALMFCMTREEAIDSAHASTQDEYENDEDALQDFINIHDAQWQDTDGVFIYFASTVCKKFTCLGCEYHGNSGLICSHPEYLKLKDKES